MSNGTAWTTSNYNTLIGQYSKKDQAMKFGWLINM